MAGVLHALETFFGHFRDVDWRPIGCALLCQTAKTAARTRAWRNILAAAYPATRVRWRSVFGAYVAGAGVNAVVPGRAGDVLKLYLVKHRVEGASYPTLASSLLVETIVDIVLSSLLLAWALASGVLPGVDVLDRFPSVDWFWLFKHPRVAAVLAGAALVIGFAAGVWASARIRAFGERVARGLTVLRSPARYLRSVAVWQLVDWGLRLAAIYFFLQAFHIPAKLDNVLRVQVTQSLSTIVPLTPAGIGTEQALVVYVLAGEASRTALLSLSVGIKLISSAWTFALGIAASALMLRTLRWRRLVARDPS
jgi:uncharacterized membrane protein YbhN (UPF0104 family)